MRWNKSAALLICGFGGAAACSPLQAQDYPSRNVTLVLPLAAGTGLDTIARLYGEKLSEGLGRPVIVENRPGANIVMATQQRRVGKAKRAHACLGNTISRIYCKCARGHGAFAPLSTYTVTFISTRRMGFRCSETHHVLGDQDDRFRKG